MKPNRAVQLRLHIQSTVRDRSKIAALQSKLSITKWILAVLDAAAGFDLPPELPDSNYNAPATQRTRAITLRLRLTRSRFEMYEEAAANAALDPHIWASVVLGVACGESYLNCQLSRLAATPRVFIPDTTEVHLIGDTSPSKRRPSVVEARA